MELWLFLTGAIGAFLIPTTNFYLNDKKNMYLYYALYILFGVIFILYTFGKYNDLPIPFYSDLFDIERVLHVICFLFYYYFLLEVIDFSSRPGFLKRLLLIQIYLTFIGVVPITIADNVDVGMNVDLYITGPIGLISLILNFVISYYFIRDREIHVKLIGIAYLTALSIVFITFIVFISMSLNDADTNPHLAFIVGLLIELSIINYALNNMNYRRIQEVSSLHVGSELKALRAQMNPHFIFNSLNSIQGFIRENDIKSASKYLGEFARLMRTNLGASEEAHISLDEEVAMIEDYLKLQKLRFKDRFDYSIEVKTSANSDTIYIPSLLVQPIVENAVLHGVKDLDKRGEIKILYQEIEEMLVVDVSDNGPGIRKTSKLTTVHRSLGIELVQKRLNLLSDGNSSLEMNSVEGEGTRVTLKIGINFRH